MNWKMFTCFRWVWLIVTCTAIFAAKPVGAEEPSNYQRIQVDGRLSLALPRDWLIADDDGRRSLGEFADELEERVQLEAVPMVVALAADSPSPSRGTVRVFFVPTPGLGQSVKQDAVEIALQRDRDEMIANLSEVWQAEMKALAETFSHHGVDVLDHGPADIEAIDGLHAFTYTYRHSGFIEKSARWRAKQYHIPLGDEKAVLTLSYRESDSGFYESIIEKIKNSVEVQ